MKAPKTGGKSFPITKAGSYLAVCYAVCDLGTHKQTYQGKERDRRLCLITFEIPGERIEIEKEDGTKEDKPRAISIQDTFSMHQDSNLRKKMESWRGQPFSETQAFDFDFKSLLGVNALIQVAHQVSKTNNRKYAFIQSANTPLAEMEKINSDNQHLFFEFAPPYVTPEGFSFPENMPDWVVDKIKESREYQDLSDMQNNGVTEPEQQSTREAQSETMKEEKDEPPF